MSSLVSRALAIQSHVTFFASRTAASADSCDIPMSKRRAGAMSVRMSRDGKRLAIARRHNRHGVGVRVTDADPLTSLKVVSSDVEGLSVELAGEHEGGACHR